MCAGFEFVPCHKCGGSKNSVSNTFTIEFRALRCTHCNENGLEACPSCTEREDKESLKSGEEESEGGVGMGGRGSDEAVECGKEGEGEEVEGEGEEGEVEWEEDEWEEEEDTEVEGEYDLEQFNVR